MLHGFVVPREALEAQTNTKALPPRLQKILSPPLALASLGQRRFLEALLEDKEAGCRCCPLHTVAGCRKRCVLEISSDLSMHALSSVSRGTLHRIRLRVLPALSLRGSLSIWKGKGCVRCRGSRRSRQPYKVDRYTLDEIRRSYHMPCLLESFGFKDGHHELRTHTL